VSKRYQKWSQSNAKPRSNYYIRTGISTEYLLLAPIMEQEAKYFPTNFLMSRIKMSSK